MIERNAKGHFLPGSGGRPAGARNKLQHDLLKALADDFAEHGVEVVRIVRIERPADYLKIAVSILPKELMIEASGALVEMSDDEIKAALAIIKERRAEATH